MCRVSNNSDTGMSRQAPFGEQLRARQSSITTHGCTQTSFSARPGGALACCAAASATRSGTAKKTCNAEATDAQPGSCQTAKPIWHQLQLMQAPHRLWTAPKPYPGQIHSGSRLRGGRLPSWLCRPVVRRQGHRAVAPHVRRRIQQVCRMLLMPVRAVVRRCHCCIPWYSARRRQPWRPVSSLCPVHRDVLSTRLLCC